MIRSELNPTGSEPLFAREGAGPSPQPIEVTRRDLYYLLVNVEEHPEILPLAYDLVRQRLDAAQASGALSLPGPASGGDAGEALATAIAAIGAQALRDSYPWRRDTEDLTRRQVLHYYMQYMPTAFVDGCWLQCGLRVGTAFTDAGATMTGLYAHQVRAYLADPGRHFVSDYRAAYARIGAPVQEVSSRSFAERQDLSDASFGLPTFLLAIAQFTRCFTAEILGLNLTWQYLEIPGFGPALIRDLCDTYALPELGTDLDDGQYLETGQRLARAAAQRLLEGADQSRIVETWSGLMRGVNAGLAAWREWFGATEASAPNGPPDPRQEMLDLLWRKAPHASGYHANKKLGGRRIDEHLDPSMFDGPAILQALAQSRWVKAGHADRSSFLRHLVKFGGPMLAVFSPVELEIIERWIDSLPPKRPAGEHADAAALPPDTPPPTGPTEHVEVLVSGRAWARSAFQERSRRLHGKGGVRDLFHYLINVEFHPEILPVAERFARDRLERSMAMLERGERPIPSFRYDPAALERWVFGKHREQVDSYRPPDVRPEAPKDAFIEASVQLAPLILIDGGWLQGIASPALIHTTVGRMLFHVLVEEIGVGDPREHHANIYRDLLAAMGEDAPPVDSWEFARWPRLQDSSFDVPTLWLSISCFPRHFLPEILGLNLAVELAGIGGPYMEARDTLKRLGYPTLFVDVHNAADNVAAGHSAWAMNAIKRYMDDLAEREGPHSLDHAWHRVWTGVRATLPQIGRARLVAHRVARRFFGADPTLVPLIFPS